MQVNKLLYIAEENLKDRLFIKDIVHNFPQGEKMVLLHEAFKGSVSDTRFVTKRISAYFSEQMVYNNAFSADQRKLVEYENGTYRVNKNLIFSLFQHIQLFILNPIVSKEGTAWLGDPMELALALRQQLEISSTTLFPSNSLSPLANKRPVIQKDSDISYWQNLYEEEEPTLKRALSLAPVQIVPPSSYGS
ncbi:MAG: hypothetical protein AAF694_04490 [Bacteroidota bacterium]